MTTFGMFPRSGHAFSAVEVGEALAGLFARDVSGAPIPGVVGAPKVTAVASTWNVQVAPFTYVAKVGVGGVGLSGVSAAETVTITNAVGIPTGQYRRDMVCWDPSACVLVVKTGVPGDNPDRPNYSGLVPIADVTVHAGDTMLPDGRITLAFPDTWLAVEDPVPPQGVVSPRLVSPGTVVRVPVVFPADRFTVPPIVLATQLGDIRDAEVSVVDRTKDGCTIVLGSNSGNPRTFGAMWRAFGDG